MDGSSFDELARSLTTAGSRRRALALALSGALASVVTREDAEAHDLKAKCRKKSGKAKKKCLKKAKKHNATHVSEPLPPPPGPSCTMDGIKNGDESDIDCGGGTCPRCANAKSCTSRHDCATARCLQGICVECTSTTQCGLDTDNSPCVCEDGYCIKTTSAPPSVATCAECPDDTVCLGAAGLFCYKLCGAP